MSFFVASSRCAIFASPDERLAVIRSVDVVGLAVLVSRNRERRGVRLAVVMGSKLSYGLFVTEVGVNFLCLRRQKFNLGGSAVL